jgi:hypothetical protein
VALFFISPLLASFSAINIQIHSDVRSTSKVAHLYADKFVLQTKYDRNALVRLNLQAITSQTVRHPVNWCVLRLDGMKATQ